MTQTPHATMNTLLRFWSDIDNVTRAPYQAIQNDILEYLKWVQSEKARADEAESNRDKAYNRVGHQAQEISELREALAESEAREQRLKEILETIAYAPIVDNYEIECNRQKRAASRLLSTLYPDTPAPTGEERGTHE